MALYNSDKALYMPSKSKGAFDSYMILLCAYKTSRILIFYQNMDVKTLMFDEIL